MRVNQEYVQLERVDQGVEAVVEQPNVVPLAQNTRDLADLGARGMRKIVPGTGVPMLLVTSWAVSSMVQVPYK